MKRVAQINDTYVVTTLKVRVLLNFCAAW